jgi:hypothetical protein
VFPFPNSRARSGVLAAVLVVVTAAGCDPPEAGPGSRGTMELDWTLRAERSGFVETATYDEVVAYLEQASAVHPNLHLTRFGYTNQGREIPLLVVGPVDEPTPAAVRAASEEGGIPIIYLKGNIHSGEAAGKEALLRLVRELAHDQRPELLEDLILLIGPVYNADGTEAVDLRNRPRQHGPLGGMGTRTNAQGLDLNRDGMKLDSPEGRSLARFMTDFDPHMVVDLHTTNGTRHAYHLTYAPPLHPATPHSIDSLLRDDLLPTATRNWEERFGWHMWHYGNAFPRDGVTAWWTFDHRPRFVTNYTGIRNRIGILSEAYSYLTFEDRILASERFVDEILEWSRTHADRILVVVAQESSRDLRGERLPVRGGFSDEAPTHPILMGDVEEEVHPWTGETILLRTDVVVEDPMSAFVAFIGTEHEQVPDAYLVPRQLDTILDRLRTHGVELLEEEPPPGTIQEFGIQARSMAEQAFQGRHEVTLEGSWVALAEQPDPTAGDPARSADDPSGEAVGSGEWFVVPMDQPLARLVFLLLEPRSDDGLTNWGLMDPWLEDSAQYPVRRVIRE